MQKAIPGRAEKTGRPERATAMIFARLRGVDPAMGNDL